MTRATSGQPARGATAGGRGAKKRVAPRGSGENRTAIETTLAELGRLGRVEKIDAATVQMLRSMAKALDERPFNSQMWREYREAIKELLTEEANSGVENLLADLRSPVRDPEKA